LPIRLVAGFHHPHLFRMIDAQAINSMSRFPTILGQRHGIVMIPQLKAVIGLRTTPPECHHGRSLSVT
jgi:hypothetical protein